MRMFLLAALLAALAAPAAAQGVYKYTDKNGRVVYTDDPKAGGGATRPVEDKISTVTPVPATTDASRRLLRQAEQRMAALDKATSDIAAANNELRAAEARKEAGVEPVGDERQGRRFRPEYWRRQQQLQNDVNRAQARLDDALARRNAVR